jgi:1,4-dihydroxy-2-naphthoate octaprenyltransferase
MNAWIQAARLRTLPLAMSGIGLGSAYAYMLGLFQLEIMAWALLTATLLQVLSNFANDYGDFEKGTDQGRSDRSLASGSLSPAAMKRALYVTALMALVSGLALLFRSHALGLIQMHHLYMLLGLGLAAIAAAILYTVGSSAYGYKGLGDLFVFVFFGAVPVLGTVLLMGGDPYLPYPPKWFTTALYTAIAMGCFSVAVLNVNNYRDLDSDAAAGKRTLAVRLGASKTLHYHRVLLILGWICLAYSFHEQMREFFQVPALGSGESALVFGLFVPIALLLAQHFSAVKRCQPGDREALNAQLKKLAISTLLAVILYSLLALYVRVALASPF